MINCHETSKRIIYERIGINWEGNYLLIKIMNEE